MRSNDGAWNRSLVLWVCSLGASYLSRSVNFAASSCLAAGSLASPWPAQFPKFIFPSRYFFGAEISSLILVARRRNPFYVKPSREGEEGGGEEDSTGNPPQRANAAKDFHKPFEGLPPHSF